MIMAENSKTVLILDSSDERWISFVGSLPQANIFHHPAWVQLLSECYGYRSFVTASTDNSGTIIAGLPWIEVDSFITGKRWESLPFTDYCQPLYRDEYALKELTGEIIRLSQDKVSPLVEVRWELPTSPKIHSSSHYVQHTLNLVREIEDISKSLHRTQRQNIKTAEKNDIIVKRGDGLDFLKSFYNLHCLTRQRQGVPVQPWKFFRLLHDRIISKGNGFIQLALKDGKCAAAGLFLHWQKTLSYKYAASDEEYQTLRPNHLLTWDAICWGCENGYKVFDFGRTDVINEGLRTFKCRWGAEETPLYYSVISDKAPKPSSGKLMPLMNRIIQKSPLWVGRAAGEMLYKHFG
jgi:CelD/BcsL family acetyltransferase involved in cellulose biosynthesis